MHQLVITGSMCSGKTTLVQSFETDSRVVCIEDQARRYLTEHPEIDRKSLKASRGIIAAYQMATAQAQAQAGPILTIADGSVLNPIAHLRAWDDRRTSDRLLPEVLPSLRSVDMFFLMDIDDVPYVLDEVRTESNAVRRRLQRIYERLLQELQLPYCRVSGAAAIRTRQLESYIQSLSPAA